MLKRLPFSNHRDLSSHFNISCARWKRTKWFGLSLHFSPKPYFTLLVNLIQCWNVQESWFCQCVHTKKSSINPSPPKESPKKRQTYTDHHIMVWRSKTQWTSLILDVVVFCLTDGRYLNRIGCTVCTMYMDIWQWHSMTCWHFPAFRVTLNLTVCICVYTCVCMHVCLCKQMIFIHLCLCCVHLLCAPSTWGLRLLEGQFP